MLLGTQLFSLSLLPIPRGWRSSAWLNVAHHYVHWAHILAARQVERGWGVEVTFLSFAHIWLVGYLAGSLGNIVTSWMAHVGLLNILIHLLFDRHFLKGRIGLVEAVLKEGWQILVRRTAVKDQQPLFLEVRGGVLSSWNADFGGATEYVIHPLDHSFHWLRTVFSR